MSNSKNLAKLWLGLILLFATLSAFFSDQIQSHQLDQSLHVFHDVFGRNLFYLTLNAIGTSFITILPVAIVFLLLGMAISLGLTFLNPKNILVILIQALIDTLSSLPGLLIGLGMSALGRGSLLSVATATIIMVFPELIRFFESQIHHFKSQTFYASAEALGGTPLHLSKTHLIPELLQLSVAIFPFILSRVLYIETTLSFLGVGTLAHTETWGQLINQSREYLLEAPWMIMITGLPLLFTLWSFHLLTHRDSS